jgi:hypothetical protein
LYFSELPRIYYEFLKVKYIFWNFKQKRKGFFRKYVADVSMTSASWFYRAARRPEVLLGRGRPSGLVTARNRVSAHSGPGATAR